MPILYDIPLHLKSAIADGSANLIGAIIKDSVTGQILGHVQQTGVFGALLGEILPVATTGFPPLSALIAGLKILNSLESFKISGQLAQLQDSMDLIQMLQYGTLALSGVNLGVSLAGFALMDKRLRGMEKQLTRIEGAIGKVTADRREDEIGTILVDIREDLRDVDSLPTRPSVRLSEKLQRRLDRHASQLERHFTREAGIGQHGPLTLDHLERLWMLVSAIALCREAAVQALFLANQLATIEANGRSMIGGQLALWESINPDELSRLVARADHGLREPALEQARLLSDGLRGAVTAMIGNVSIARTLAASGSRGIDYVAEARAEKQRPVLFLAAPR